MATLATETWTGTNGAAWPAQWNIGVGTGTIQSNAGRLVTATSVAQAFLSTMATTSTFDITVTLSMAAATGTAAVAVGANWGDFFPQSGYILTIDFTSGSGNLALQTTDASAAPTSRVSGSLALTAGTTYSVRFRRVGGIIYARLWTGTEPGTWNLQWTDTVNQAAGRAQLSAYGTGGAGTVTTTWDNLTVTDGASVALTGSLAASGAGALALAGAMNVPGSLALSSVGFLTRAGVLAVAGSAPLAGSGALALTGSASTVTSGTLPFTGAGTLAIAGTYAPLGYSGSLALGGSGALRISGRVAGSYLFHTPYVQRRMPVLPPISALMNFSLAVLRINGQWVETEWPSEDQINAADLYFPGGHENVVDAATAFTLMAAGYTVDPIAD